MCSYGNQNIFLLHKQAWATVPSRPLALLLLLDFQICTWSGLRNLVPLRSFLKLLPNSVDAMSRWLLVACRLFLEWWKEDKDTLARVVISRRNRRIAALCKCVKTLNWKVDMSAIRFHKGAGVGWNRPWAEIREAVLMRFRQARFAQPKEDLELEWASVILMWHSTIRCSDS